MCEITDPKKKFVNIETTMKMDLLPIGRSDSKIDPAMGVSLPLENASVGNAGVGAAAAWIEGETLRPEGAVEVDYLRRVEMVVGPR